MPARMIIWNSNIRNYQRWKIQPTYRDCQLSLRNPLRLEGIEAKQNDGQDSNSGVTVLVKAGKHLTLLYFRVLDRLFTAVLGALNPVVVIVELDSLMRLSCLWQCIFIL